jgi:sulfofructose kinase
MDIVGIGHAFLDIVSVVERLPTPNKGSRIKECSRQGGGLVSTAIVAAARLGAKTGFVGVIGGCIHGKAIIDDFKFHGVDLTKSIIDHEAYSNFSIILSDLETSGRSIMFKKGTTRELTVEDLDKAYIQSAEFLHIANFSEVEITAAKWMREAGGTVVYDGNLYDEGVEKIIPYIDVFIVSEFFHQSVFGNNNYEANCRKWMKQGPGIVIVTLGKDGCVGVSKDGYFEVPTFDTPVVDTLGAGDVYHGGYIVRLLNGLSAKEAARFANAVSSIKVTSIGGRSGIPDYDMVMEFMRTGKIDYDKIGERVERYRRMWLFNEV